MVQQQFWQFAGKSIVCNAVLLFGLSVAAIAPSGASAGSFESNLFSHLSSVSPITKNLAVVTTPAAVDLSGTPLEAQQTVTPKTPEINPSPATVYLYGTSSEAQQIGQDYMVISVESDNHVQGVFYQVNSEFSCFQGEMKEGKLDLAVMDPFEPVAYNYQLNYTAGGTVAENGDRLHVQFIPEGFQPINTLGALDRDLLQQCSNHTKPASTL